MCPSLNFVPGPVSALPLLRPPLSRPRTRTPPFACRTPPHPHPHPHLIPAPLLHPPPAAPPLATSPRTLVWFRVDLRLHDHPALTHALSHPLVTPLPVYIFDPRHFGPAPSSSTSSTSTFLRTGRHRIRFLLDAVASLRAALRARGSDLLVRVGHPETVLPLLCAQLRANQVVCHRDVETPLVFIEHAVSDALRNANVSFVPLWANTLYHLDDLPFPLADTPEAYTGFREALQATVAIRPALSAPERMPPLPQVPLGDLPTPADLGVVVEPSQRLSLPGGEEHALERLNAFVCKATRGEEHVSGAEFNIRITPWIQMGCVSPRRIYWEIRNGVGDQACSSMGFELVWKDFGKFIKAKLCEERLQRKEALLEPKVGATLSVR